MENNTDHMESFKIQNPRDFNKIYFQIKSVILWGSALFVLLFCLVGASRLAEGGTNIGDIRSVAGGTVTDAYHRELKLIYQGFAHFVKGFGIFAAGFLAWLGVKELEVLSQAQKTSYENSVESLATPSKEPYENTEATESI